MFKLACQINFLALILLQISIVIIQAYFYSKWKFLLNMKKSQFYEYYKNTFCC